MKRSGMFRPGMTLDPAGGYSRKSSDLRIIRVGFKY